MNDLSSKQKYRFVLPEIRCVHPKTSELLCIVSPNPGSMFNVKLPEDLTNEELIMVISDLAEFNYRSVMAVQKRLYQMGWQVDHVSNLFFPESEKVDAKDLTNKGMQAKRARLCNAVGLSLAASERLQEILGVFPIYGTIDQDDPLKFDGWDAKDFDAVLTWASGEGSDEIPTCLHGIIDDLRKKNSNENR